MSNYIEHKEKIAFHPGYYIKETVDESGLTQEDFAKRLGTTPKNLSLLLRGEQSMSIDIAMKLSRLIGTSIDYWLNLQRAYDALIAEFKSEEELANEREVFKNIGYKYFQDNFNLPNLSGRKNEQIKQVRKFLNVSTLSVLTKQNMAVSFRSSPEEITGSNITKANIMVQIATNIALNTDAPKYSKKLFEEAVESALLLTKDHTDFYPKIKEAFLKAGVIFVILPNFPGSKINGATKKVGENIILMVNDRRLFADTFWFTLFHEIGHIINGDYGVSFDKENGEKEEKANEYAQHKLIPSEKYCEYIANRNITLQSIKSFASSINRDPGIILGRLQNDGLVKYDDRRMNSLRSRYKITINN
jgi:HTH-type transcriptional regulator/antitoxin HigA